jgi:predicted anti-sigma-YlaC factor YlaD
MSADRGSSGDDHLGEMLSALLDHELAPGEVARAEEHLASCAECRAERDRLAQARQAVRDLPVLDLPPPLWVQIMRSRRRAARPVAWVGAAAAAVALIGLAAVPTQQHHVTPQMAHLVQVHAASSGAEPVTGMAPATVNANFVP